jgi:hypothetical protein
MFAHYAGGVISMKLINWISSWLRVKKENDELRHKISNLEKTLRIKEHELSIYTKLLYKTENKK